MKPVQVYGIIVRVFGLSMLIYSIWNLVYGLATAAGGVPEEQPGYKTGYFLTGSMFLILSLYFLRGAPLLLRFSYPDEGKADEGKNV